MQPALFLYLRGVGTWWLNTMLSCSLQLQAAYWAVGWLLAQALVNRCTVGLQLAPLLFHRLLLQPCNMLEVSATGNRHTSGVLPAQQHPAACHRIALYCNGLPWGERRSRSKQLLTS